MSCQAQFHVCLGFLHAVLTHLNHIPVLSPSLLSLLHWLCIFFFFLNLRSRSLLSHAIFLPAWQDFLHIVMVSSRALRKVAVQCCQLRSAPMSLRTIFREILFTNPLNRSKFSNPQGPEPSPCHAHAPQDHKFPQGMAATAQAASRL